MKRVVYRLPGILRPRPRCGGVEFGLPGLQVLLGYKEWRNFSKVLEKARESCQNAKHNISDHFVDVNKMVPLGSGSEREIADIMLTRYACYLIAQNGDPRKEEIAFARGRLSEKLTRVRSKAEDLRFAGRFTEM
jgi:DNA-damage-inducible protein D